MRQYTITEYEMEDYNEAKRSMTKDDIINHLEFISRGYIGNYNFTGEEDDFKRYKLHMAICRAIDIIQEARVEK